jgi:hypothetical protein
MNAFGNVEVRIVISEAGQVIEAAAISGHPALRRRGCGRGAPVGLQTIDARWCSHTGGNSLDL